MVPLAPAKPPYKRSLQRARMLSEQHSITIPTIPLFVGAYKPTTKSVPVTTIIGTNAVPVKDENDKENDGG